MYFYFTVCNTSIPGGPGLFLRANFLGGSRVFLSDGTDFIYRTSKYGCYLQLMILAWDSTLDSQARTDSMLVHGNDTSEWYRKFQLKQNPIVSNIETYQYFQDNTRVAHRFWGNSDKLKIEKNQIN